MKNKFIAILLVAEFVLLYLGGTLPSMLMGIAGACLLVGMAIVTIATRTK